MPYLTQIQRLADNEHRPMGSGKSPRLNQFGLSQGYIGKNVVKAGLYKRGLRSLAKKRCVGSPASKHFR